MSDPDSVRGRAGREHRAAAAADLMPDTCDEMYMKRTDTIQGPTTFSNSSAAELDVVAALPLRPTSRLTFLSSDETWVKRTDASRGQ